jgi:ribosomal protein S18 acetylase RimI-like enzyme
LEIIIKESREISRAIELFDKHKDAPFTYLMNIPLIRMLSQLEKFKIFIAEANGEVIGCIYSLNYVYDSGYVGGLLVHKDFRNMGIGSRLLNTALSHIESRYVYLLVMEENNLALRLFEKAGFRRIYKRLYYIVSQPFNNFYEKEKVTYDVEWHDLKNAVGFSERKRVINFGYYPVKMTEKVFKDLKRKGKVLKYGSILAIIEELHGLVLEDKLYTFNDYVFRKLRDVEATKRIIEVNPFYTRLNPSDLTSLLNHLLSLGEVHVRTYYGDPVASKLPLPGNIGALTMEYEK